MDFKGFKKVHDDEKLSIMQNDAGHKIHIVKDALTPKLRKHLGELPLYQAEPDAPVPANSEDPGAYNILSATEGGTPTSPPSQPTPSPMAQQAPAPQQPDAAPQQDFLAAPQGDYVSQMPGGREAEAAIGLSEASEEARAKQELSARQSEADFLQKDVPQLKQDLGGIQQERDAVTQELLNKKIDPNQYWKDKSTLGQVSTAIGLILGGAGSGLTGGPNVALDFLNRNIDRNLEAQRLDMANRHNLLSALGQQYGDTMTRDNLFRSISAQTMANQIGMAAAQSATPQAQANALAATSQLKQQAAQWLRQAQLAHMQGWVQGAASGPGGVDQRANAYLQAARVLDPKSAEEFEKRYIPGVGVASVPLEAKDRETLQKKSELQSMLNEADTFLKGSGTLGPILPERRAEGQALQNRINLRMGELADLTRFTPEENKIYKRSVPDLTGTHFTSKDQALLDGLKQENNDSLNTFYKQKGLNVAPAGSEERITVIAPNGKSGSVSKLNLQSALSQGYRLPNH